MNRSKWKQPYIELDFITLFFPKLKNKNIHKKYKTKIISSLNLMENFFSFYTKSRSTQLTSFFFKLQNKVHIYIYTGKKYFIFDKFIKNINVFYKIGEYIYTRVNKQHILKVLSKKKLKIKK